MATRNLSTFVLMVAIIFWGTLLGGIAYSHLVYFPAYLSDLPASAVVVNGPYGLNEGIFWGIIHPLLIISLVAALVLNWNSSARRKLIAISFAVYVIVLLVSVFYFIPELVLFKNSPQSTVPATDWLARGRRWQRLSWLRGATMYLAFVPLLFALTKPAKPVDERVVL
jgi:glucan phosphoethanolaminetransferase (alkaline phosphatase superfamily)